MRSAMSTTAAIRIVLTIGASLGAGAEAQITQGPPNSPATAAAYEYDGNGNPTRTIAGSAAAGLSFASVSSFDLLGRLTRSVNAASAATGFSYNGRQDVVQVVDPRGLVTQYSRNGYGDAFALASPDTGQARVAHDAAGNIISRTDSRGVMASYSYDRLNRLIKISYSQFGLNVTASGDQSFNYDETGPGFSNSIGHLTSTRFQGGWTQHAYDSGGRLTVDTQAVSPTAGSNTQEMTTRVGYSYDASGNLVAIQYPSGRVLHFWYADGKPVAILVARDGISTAIPLLGQIEFNPFGGVRAWNWYVNGGLRGHNRDFDTTGRLVRYPLGSLLRDLHYDSAGRIISYTHLDRATGAVTAKEVAWNQAFSYDAAGRIVRSASSGDTYSLNYDPSGNRTVRIHNGALENYDIETSSNRLLGVNQPTRSFTYDNSGNVVTDRRGPRNAYYDQAGRLTSLAVSRQVSNYTYDAKGRRVRKYSSVSPQSTVIFVYDQYDHLLGEYDYAGGVVREYAWLGDTPVVMLSTQPGSNEPAVHYIHTDHLNTPRVVLDTNNRTRWRWLGDPFGGSFPETDPEGLGAFTFNLRFPGQYADLEGGFYYNYHRYYDPATGRYVQSDPIGLQGGINTYAYVENNPLRYTDPMGLDRWGDQPGFRWGTKPGVPLPEGKNSSLYTFSMCVQECYGSPIMITSTNEPYIGHLPGTAHGDSAAIDVRYSAISDPEKALCCAAQCGARYAIDEAKSPSRHSSAPHFHLELPHPRNRNWTRGNLPAGECSKC